MATESVRHRSNRLFNFDGIHHDDSVPRAAIQKATVGTFTNTFLATDAQNRIHLNSSEWGMVFVWHPEHTILHWAILHTRR